MCGRFVANNELETIKEVFNPKIAPSLALGENYNVSPSQNTFVINKQKAAVIELNTKVWGFTATWDTKRRLANARSESILQKASFKDSYLYRRCLVPINGYYEWFRVNEKPTQAYFIYSKKMKLLPVAGIYLDDEMTILTTSANARLSAIHDRMPVLVPPRNWESWLDQSITEPGQIQSLIPSAPLDFLDAYPVSSSVNNSRSKGKNLIDPIGPEI